MFSLSINLHNIFLKLYLLKVVILDKFSAFWPVVNYKILLAYFMFFIYFIALPYPEQQRVKDIGRPEQKYQLCYKLCDWLLWQKCKFSTIF